MMLQSGVINGPKNPQFVFRSTLTGEIRSEDAELTVNYVDGKGQTGVLFGVNARPLTEGPVSYTHLDVYKRQTRWLPSPGRKDSFAVWERCSCRLRKIPPFR